MNPPIVPAEAASQLSRKLQDRPWFRRVAVEGVGGSAIIVLLVIDLQAAQAFIGTIAGRYSGYPVQARRVSP